MRKLCIVIGMLWLCVTSCGDSYQSSIPSVTFNFSCSLSQSPYYKITTPGQFLKIEKNVNGLPVGYAGLIIGQSVFSEGNTYVAYDAACPVEASRNVSVEVLEDGLGTAECPKCHTWWNGRHEGLKILWPLRLCGFKSRFEYQESLLID